MTRDVKAREGHCCWAAGGRKKVDQIASSYNIEAKTGEEDGVSRGEFEESLTSGKRPISARTGRSV